MGRLDEGHTACTLAAARAERHRPLGEKGGAGGRGCSGERSAPGETDRKQRARIPIYRRPDSAVAVTLAGLGRGGMDGSEHSERERTARTSDTRQDGTRWDRHTDGAKADRTSCLGSVTMRWNHQTSHLYYGPEPHSVISLFLSFACTVTTFAASIFSPLILSPRRIFFRFLHPPIPADGRPRVLDAAVVSA